MVLEKQLQDCILPFIMENWVHILEIKTQTYGLITLLAKTLQNWSLPLMSYSWISPRHYHRYLKSMIAVLDEYNVQYSNIVEKLSNEKKISRE